MTTTVKRTNEILALTYLTNFANGDIGQCVNNNRRFYTSEQILEIEAMVDKYGDRKKRLRAIERIKKVHEDLYDQLDTAAKRVKFINDNPALKQFAKLPDVVTEQSTGVKTVNPDNMTWYLVNAVKELSAEVERLKANSHPCKELHEFDAYPDLIKRIEELENK